VSLIAQAGGIASLAHPGYTKQDEVIPDLVAAGLAAIEAYHSAHDEPTTQRYIDMARYFGLAVSGGSDFHGAGTRRSEFFGVVNLPAEEFDRFVERRAHARETASTLIG
jgi:predicted metal-dependent phosphoesterase TrpH